MKRAAITKTIPTQKSRPVIFKGEMVRAILEGRKTQTRCIIKLKFPFSAGIAEVAGYHMGTTEVPPVDMRVTLRRGVYHHMDFMTFAEKYCPYGVAGDRLWVRETWRITELWLASAGRSVTIQWKGDATESYRYECDHEKLCLEDWKNKKGRWISSIHMPRWASRITLEITKVRVERLQDISEEDAIAEGIETREGLWRDYSGPDPVFGRSPILSYASLWESINGAGAWEKNPWVWVIDFCRVTEEKV